MDTHAFINAIIQTFTKNTYESYGLTKTKDTLMLSSMDPKVAFDSLMKGSNAPSRLILTSGSLPP